MFINGGRAAFIGFRAVASLGDGKSVFAPSLFLRNVFDYDNYNNTNIKIKNMYMYFKT